ncbi:hypothetical protein M2459_000085 [Parabacteroides sp. PF5-5]|uniref:Outer membrane protein SusF domain-containing protein n=1 Tax=unclassified Parabacteroides TaxID=2649774 RepID=UPI002473FB4D|nr:MULTISPECIES: DUF5115 domain-containing protein [unclassified Parabacteroides]MDH6303753.1 hypothetical protein [Parabacteroides sp. PH5-39]MDH6314370.1 hypothetical protein [Parabacteroides sp. PF5-13]MDH6318565.1 hypothetical protein [Parabacteroides sp. PH5-13]MDH6322142.1 hypothetical protein [Parabacteroides sp. PH5-8]MDH6325778.1 hypothetical protein [Parabacteroides sp. PH5-41]
MKKLSLYFILLLIITGFSACDEDFNKDIADPQTNEPETAMDVNFQIANLEAAYDLNGITEDRFSILKSSSSPAVEEGAAVSYELHFSPTEDGAGKMMAVSELSNGNFTVDTKDIQTIIEKMFDKRPVAREIFVKAISRIQPGDGQVVLVQSNQLKVTLTPKSSVIESAYYLIGDMNGWNPENVTKFGHSGNDVYEDPIFSILLEVGANTYFKIAPQSAVDALAAGGDFWGAVIGTAIDGDASLTGGIVTENAQAMKIESAGYVRITLNMEEYTYTIEPISFNPNLYVPGNHQSWNPATAPTLYTEKMDMVYEGFVYLDGEYKFTSEPNWDNTNYGKGDAGKLSTDGGAGNLSAEAGFYYLKADLNLLTYQQTKTDWGLIGSATPGGWDSSTPMTYDRDTNTWSVKVAMTGGDEFKFRANDAWDINMGGSPDKLVSNGGNIKVDASGTYLVSLKLLNPMAGYTCTIVKQ